MKLRNNKNANNNLLLTEGEGRTPEYWPEVVTVQTDLGPIFPEYGSSKLG